MSCGKRNGRKLRKLWDQPKKLRSVTPSKYEQQVDHGAIDYWKNVLSELEASHLSDNQDECWDKWTDKIDRDEFWEQKGEELQDLVGETVFERLRKIFNLPKKPVDYEMMDDVSTLVSSAECYKDRSSAVNKRKKESFSMSDISPLNEETEGTLDEESWSLKTDPGEISEQHQHVKLSRSTIKSIRTVSKSSNIFGRTASFTTDKQSKSESKTLWSFSSHSLISGSAKSEDDLFVHAGDFQISSRQRRPLDNPYYDMLYCNESETDMIKWDSNYKTKRAVTVDEASKQAKLKTKKLAKDFFDWWASIGTENYKSDIRKPQDIEALFQLWFDEHESKGLIVDKKIIPCVLKSIAHYISEAESSCERMLQKYVKWDIASEAIPYKTIAFGSGLPTKMKQIPPKNNTDKIWNCLKIPEDLKSMACIWEDIQHLTSTKCFKEWLVKHPSHAMPPVLRTESQALLHKHHKMHKHIVLPSDLLLREASLEVNNLTVPFSTVNIELKEVLSKLMNQ